jgi:hypothetical protein
MWRLQVPDCSVSTITNMILSTYPTSPHVNFICNIPTLPRFKVRWKLFNGYHGIPFFNAPGRITTMTIGLFYVSDFDWTRMNMSFGEAPSINIPQKLSISYHLRPPPRARWKLSRNSSICCRTKVSTFWELSKALPVDTSVGLNADSQGGGGGLWRGSVPPTEKTNVFFLAVQEVPG